MLKDRDMLGLGLSLGQFTSLINSLLLYNVSKYVSHLFFAIIGLN